MPTYKGIEMPANNADKIGAMIESAKNKLMGTPVGDFVRGVGAVGTIPNTIVAGTQNSYGANIPTVEGLKQNLTASVEQGNIASDVGTGVSRTFNNVNTPTFGATVNQPLLNMVKEGAAKSTPAVETPLGGIGVQPLAGARATKDSGLADWQAERDRQNSIMNGKSSEYLALEKERSNPNNAMFKEVADKIKDISTFLSGDPLTRKYQIQQMGALKGVLNELGPLTSYGNFGVAGMQDETKKRDQDITSETTRRGQDIEGAIKKPYYEANAEESKAKSRLYGTQTKLLEEEGKPDKVREREVSGWLTERQKVVNAALEGIADMTPEEKEKHMATLKADFNKHNPAPIRKAKQNADGTVTVEYADGRVVTGKPKK